MEHTSSNHRIGIHRIHDHDFLLIVNCPVRPPLLSSQPGATKSKISGADIITALGAGCPTYGLVTAWTETRNPSSIASPNLGQGLDKVAFDSADPMVGERAVNLKLNEHVLCSIQSALVSDAVTSCKHVSRFIVATLA